MITKERKDVDGMEGFLGGKPTLKEGWGRGANIFSKGNWVVFEEKLSDGSLVYNVSNVNSNGPKIELSAPNETQAYELATCLAKNCLD